MIHIINIITAMAALLCGLRVNVGTSVSDSWTAGTVITADSAQVLCIRGDVFVATSISESIVQRMQGKSLPAGASVKTSDLRYLMLLHYNLRGEVCTGEMVCNKAIATDLIDIFKELYEARYPIERMVLIDDYDANDEASMEANNTSCFCYRAVNNGSGRLSAHSLGLAVDLNPLYNPCVRNRNGRQQVEPTNGIDYVDRIKSFPYKIDQNDLAYRLFTQHGFTWGGAWRSLKDYQHFEKK